MVLGTPVTETGMDSEQNKVLFLVGSYWLLCPNFKTARGGGLTFSEGGSIHRMNINDHAEEFGRGLDSMTIFNRDTPVLQGVSGMSLVLLALSLSAVGLVSGYAFLYR